MKSSTMKLNIHISLTFFYLLILLNSCTKISEDENEKIEIKKITKAIDSCIGWAKEKDLDLLFNKEIKIEKF